jgi:small subunit ribosomal protein S8e
MVLNQARSNRQPSGARYKYKKVRRQHESGRSPSLTKIGEKRNQQARTIGGNSKDRALYAKNAQVVDPKTNKHSTAEILNVEENNANRHFVRRNIITKGAIIETEKGLAKVTSRPGQEGAIHAVLLQ